MAGAHTLEPHKLLGKIAGVVVPHCRCDLLNLQMRVVQQGSGLVSPFFVDKINKADTHLLVKQAGQIVGVNGQCLGGVLDS